jgi:outer membrane protein TolC
VEGAGREALHAALEDEGAAGGTNGMTSQDRRESLAGAVSASRNAVGLARDVYLAGLGDFLSVLEAQRSQFAAEAELQRSETALRSSLIALFKALGGGIQ